MFDWMIQCVRREIENDLINFNCFFFPPSLQLSEILTNTKAKVMAIFPIEVSFRTITERGVITQACLAYSMQFKRLVEQRFPEWSGNKQSWP